MSNSRSVSEHRATLGPAAVASAAVALALHGLILRPRMLAWGATRDEAARSYPGDELIPGAGSSSTMATTLPARNETAVAGWVKETWPQVEGPWRHSMPGSSSRTRLLCGRGPGRTNRAA